MALSITKIKKFAFDKKIISLIIAFVFLLSGARWYILQQEENIVINFTDFLGILSSDLLNSQNLAQAQLFKKSESEKETNERMNDYYEAMERTIPLLINKSFIINHYEKISQLNNHEYDNNLSNISNAIVKGSNYQQKVIIDNTTFVDFFIVDNINYDKKSFWRVRINVADIKEIASEPMYNIIILFMGIGILIFIIFLYINMELKALNIEGNNKRKQLDKINAALRNEQDSVLKHQTELIVANQRSETIKNQLLEYTEYLEKSKRAMLNILQDIDTARKEADKANNAKSIFLASMSHGFRTPMNGILGMLDICLGTKLTKEQKDYLETAHASGIVLMSVLNDILDYSKIEAGKLEIETAPFDFYRIIYDVSRLFRQKIYEKDLELVVSIDSNIPNRLIGDSTRIRQVISNILGNSVKFTAEGYILLKVFIKNTEQGSKLQIEITDTGSGMSYQEQMNLFKPFTQADAAISQKHSGTGLGLTISKRLVELMNGKILVQSEEGVGSTFFVELPLIFEEITTYHFNEQLRDKSILITIANEALLENVKSCLQDYGTHYMVVREIGDIKRIDASLWDAYLLDFQLPNSKDFLDGFNDIMERNKKFKIIGLFNYLQHEMAEEIKKQSNVEIVYKPILIRQLHDALTDVFKITKNISESEETIRFSKIAEKINKNIKILVAEDNIVNQKVIKGYFEKLGLKSIRIVENGLEALEAIQDTQFDIVFMDIQMPVMDGLITTMTIRKNEKETHTHLPIVALTAHSFIGEKQRCFDAGVDDYLGKPIQIDRLVICLEKWTANNKITSSEIELVSSESVAIVSEDITNDKVEIDFDFFTHTKEALGKSFLDVISSFITDSLEKIDLIEKAIRDDDKNAIRFCAHQLKSSSGSLGVKRLSEISKKLETAAKDPIYPKENIKIIFKALIAEFAKAKDFLEDEV